MKFCKDCKHFVDKCAPHYFERVYLCCRLPHETDLVTGEELIRFLSCDKERAHIVGALGRKECGAEGRFWEAR